MEVQGNAAQFWAAEEPHEDADRQVTVGGESVEGNTVEVGGVTITVGYCGWSPVYGCGNPGLAEFGGNLLPASRHGEHGDPAPRGGQHYRGDGRAEYHRFIWRIK